MCVCIVLSVVCVRDCGGVAVWLCLSCWCVSECGYALWCLVLYDIVLLTVYPLFVLCVCYYVCVCL